MFQCYGQHKVVSKFEVHTCSNMLWGIQISMFWLELQETMWEIYPLWTMYTSNIIKSNEIFTSGLYIHKKILWWFLEFSDKF